MEKRHIKFDVFARLTHIIDFLTYEKVFTDHDKSFLLNYVVGLFFFRTDLKRILMENIVEFDENFYKDIFCFSDDKPEFLYIPHTDLFIPLLRHCYNLIVELKGIKEKYFLHGNTEELRKIIRPTFILITDNTKFFLFYTIKHMCEKYTVKVKNNEISADISSEFKAEIDYFIKRAMENQHHEFFEPIESFARTTDSYVTMCKYLKILKNSVDEMCTITTDELFGNITKTKTELLDYFVPGCPNVHKNVTGESNEMQKYLSEPREPNAILSGHQRSLLTIREPNILSTNMETQGSSYVFWLCILSFSMFFIIAFKKLFCK